MLDIISVIIAGLGVLISAVGLGFIWWQVKKLKEQTSLQNYHEYTKRYQEIIRSFPEEINTKPLDLFKGKELKMIQRAMRFYFDLCFEEWDLNKKGLIDDIFWDIWKDGIKTAMKRPAFQESWKIVRNSSGFGKEFNKFMNGLTLEKTSS